MADCQKDVHKRSLVYGALLAVTAVMGGTSVEHLAARVGFRRWRHGMVRG